MRTIMILFLDSPTQLPIASLADGEKHGYGIMKEIATKTGDKLRLGQGTLYGAIKRLLEGDLIEESAERPDPAHQDERRRYSRLTEFGQHVAAAEAACLEELMRLARNRRLLPDKFPMHDRERGHIPWKRVYCGRGRFTLRFSISTRRAFVTMMPRNWLCCWWICSTPQARRRCVRE